MLKEAICENEIADLQVTLERTSNTSKNNRLYRISRERVCCRSSRSDLTPARK
jgi:hypothetical protein